MLLIITRCHAMFTEWWPSPRVTWQPPQRGINVRGHVCEFVGMYKHVYDMWVVGNRRECAHHVRACATT